jgi:CheY-like chemotaxis protein
MDKILYAEDEFTNRKLIEFGFLRKGVQCDLASDGYTALELFRSNPYSAVILDQFMPGISGSEVARKIRVIDSEIPLIAITSDECQIPELKKAGFTRIFLKPLSILDCVDEILELVESRQSHQS